jgi:hypothetical protein
MPMPAANLTGIRFGQLIAERRNGQRNNHALWICKCDCGKEVVVSSSHLRNGMTRSCGCLRRDRAAKLNLSHGEAADLTTEYRAWGSMLSRCTNPSHRGFKNYGGRGIKVCRNWLESYAAFLADMGRRPTSKHSLDRINNDGDYEPGNCRWATAKEQQNNRRVSIKRFEGHDA